MSRTVEEYLAQLKNELLGSDVALMQDALSDAEEYLRTALESARSENPKIVEDDALSSIIEKYGTPQEIATAYREVESFKPGDLIALMSAGAYGFSMSSTYNSRPRVAEVMVKGDKYYTIREREGYEDLVRGEVIPDFLL